MPNLTNNFPRNCWWVAATSREVAAAPLSRWLLDEPVVLYRLSGGGVVALEDRCPHRWAPLSEGRLINDRLICRYHGAQFGPDGTCTKVPSQNSAPPAAKVKSYPVVEREGYVWIWMGDEERARKAPPPQLEFSESSSWSIISGFMPVACNYFLIQENVLDLTHFPYLHADTLEQDGWEAGLSDISVSNGEVTYRKDVANAPVAPFIGLPIDVAPTSTSDRCDWGTFVLPSTHIAGIDFRFEGKKARDGSPDLKFRIAHLTTPESSNRTHYWWVVGLNYGRSDETVVKAITQILEDTFAQDKALLERIQENVDRDHRGTNLAEVSFIADRPGLLARKVLMERLADESSPQAPT